MNTNTDALKDAAAQVILSALHLAEQTGAWLKGQIPDVLRQLLIFNAVGDAVTIAAFLVLAFFYARFMRAFSNKYQSAKAAYKDDKFYFGIDDVPMGIPSLIVSIGGGAFVLFLGIASVVNAIDLMEILIAPKVWILEYARHLL